MDIEIDGLGEQKSEWVFCGRFPLVEIASGRRACRKGWRNRGTDADMLAVVPSQNNDGTTSLSLERESTEAFEDYELYSDVTDMLATDWYLEKEESSPALMIIDSPLVPEDRIVATIDALLGQAFWLHDLETMFSFSRLQDDHDGTEQGTLCVMFSPDGDARVWIDGVPSGTAVRFRTAHGGGVSFRTRVALLILAYAIKRDGERPLR